MPIYCIVKKETVRQEVDLDHIHLPDPVKTHIESLEAQVKALSEQIDQMKQQKTED